MTNTIDDWLDSDDEPTPEQRTFWEECLLHAKELEDFGIATVQLDSGASGGFLFLIFDVGDTLHNKALRDLHIEFDGDKVRCGEDKRNWLEGFDPQEPVSVFGGTPAECVRFVLQWLQREWTRPVDLHEWMGENLLHQGELYEVVVKCGVMS